MKLAYTDLTATMPIRLYQSAVQGLLSKSTPRNAPRSSNADKATCTTSAAARSQRNHVPRGCRQGGTSLP